MSFAFGASLPVRLHGTAAKSYFSPPQLLWSTQVIAMPHRHFIVHKPFGMISMFVYNQSQRKNKRMLGELHDFPTGTMAIGRLDEDSEGLLLLTTDGMMSEQVRSRKVEKEYHAQVDGIITDEAIARLEGGLDIGVKGTIYRTGKCRAGHIRPAPSYPPRAKERHERHGPTSWVSITLTEGKLRQVRKMTAAVGFPTLRLVRVRIGNIHLGDLPSGAVREVEGFEV
jgi:23S rRNA pseudouridine2457 synthase